MDKLSRLFVRRLRHLAHRDARRRALSSGLLELKIIQIDGHLVRRYTPAFDTSLLTGDLKIDIAWLQRNFATVLAGPGATIGDESITTGTTALDIVRQMARKAPDIATNAAPRFATQDGHGPTPVLRLSSGALRSGSSTPLTPTGIGDRRAYAVRIVGMSAAHVSALHIATVLLIARSIDMSGMTLRQVIDVVKLQAPIIMMHAPIGGFETATLKLVEQSGFIPTGPFAGTGGDTLYDEHVFDFSDGEPRRKLVHFLGEGFHRGSGTTMRRRLAIALGSGYPVVAIAEDMAHIPEQVSLAADLALDAAEFDQKFIRDLFEAIYDAPNDQLTGSVSFDPRWLALEDIVLAMRPGRPSSVGLDVLRQLADRNRREEDGEKREKSAAPAKSAAVSSDRKPADSQPKKSTPSDIKDRMSKKDKPSGAEIILPDVLTAAGPGSMKPPVTIEALSGYGNARQWALDLQVDVAEYRAGNLDWSDLSAKLLLSGPPGTGKTTFAKALCNGLGLPLVVTSVSTWLQGGHLDDVLSRMVRTFAEARENAPSILFVDEIDGIGKRMDPDRPYADYWNAVVNKLLELLDGAVKSEGVIVIGATNRPEQIDEAVTRSGRLETHIEIPKPDIAALAGIIAHHLGDDLKVLKQRTVKSGRQEIERAIGDGLQAELMDHLSTTALGGGKQ